MRMSLTLLLLQTDTSYLCIGSLEKQVRLELVNIQFYLCMVTLTQLMTGSLIVRN